MTEGEETASGLLMCLDVSPPWVQRLRSLLGLSYMSSQQGQPKGRAQTQDMKQELKFY